MGEAKAKKAVVEKARSNRKLPENIDLLHGGELGCRAEAVKAIEANPDLMDHIELVEMIMDYVHFFAHRPTKSLDHETVNLLAGRAWTDLAAALGQALRGYYQISIMIQRDVMEIVFLLGMFLRDDAYIKQWRESDHKTRRDVFGPVKVREFLDTYDGYLEGKRGKNYRMFCEYAAHPTQAGFALMGPTGGKPQIGPFHDAGLLNAVIVELAQLAGQLGVNASQWFDADNDVQAIAVQLNRLEVMGEWMERYFGRTADRKGIAEMKQMLAIVAAKG